MPGKIDRYAVLHADGRTVSLEPSAARCLLALMFNPYLTTGELSEAIWPDPDEMPDLWIEGMWQRVFRVNRILKPGGVKISSDQNNGWRLVTT